jgi:hypothetical protein
MLSQALDALSYPLRKTKEAVSGDELEWFSPDGLNPHVYAAGNTFLDLVADPLNFLPLGLLGKGAKLAKEAGHARGSLRGLFSSSTSNWIPNFYGLTDGAKNKLSKAEQLGVDQLVKRTGVSEKEALGAIRKGAGFGGWLGQGAKHGLKNMADPRARALHRETGANPRVQSIVDDLIRNDPKSRDLEKAGANLNYLSHINKQSARDGVKDASIEGVARRSNLEDYAPNESGTISQWMKKHAGTEQSGKAVDLPDADAKFIEDHIQNAWGPTDNVVMKRGRSGPGGNHYNDIFQKLLPAEVIQDAVMKSPDDIGGYLKKHYPKGGDNWMLKKSNDDGSAWIRSAGNSGKQENVGNAITEGGINWVMKIEPDGRLTGVMSDKHDFLEKVPLIGPAVSSLTPKSVLAVSPPMHHNIKRIRKKQFKGETSPRGTPKAAEGAPHPKGETLPSLLEDFVKLRPSDKGVRAEELKQAGLLSGLLLADKEAQ